MHKNANILIVGHDDVIERSLLSYLTAGGYSNVVSSSKIALNASVQASVYEYFSVHKPDYVFLGSTQSGGIEANQKFAADFIYHNCEAQNNIIYAANNFGTKKLLYFASSCVYPKECPQPMPEELILTGTMESTSLPYSLAKSAGIVLCQSFKKQYGLNAVVMIPATVYGPGSDTDLEKAHVMGALIAKFTKAQESNEKKVVLWGTGKPRREFLYSEDFAEACLLLMDKYNGDEVVNVGCGEDIAIEELASQIAKIINFQGEIVYDTTKPDGVYQKLLDNRRISKLGWKPKVDLKEGIRRTYEWYKEVKQNSFLKD